MKSAPNPIAKLMHETLNFATALEGYKKVESLRDSGTKFFRDDTDIYATIDKPQQASEYNLSIISGEDGNPSAKLNPVRRAVKVCIAGLGDTSTGDITDKVMAAMTGEAADSAVDSMANIYARVKYSEDSEEAFNDILATIKDIDTTLPEKKINPAGLSPRLKTLYENLEALRQCPEHIDNTLNSIYNHYNKTHAPAGSIFQIAKEHYETFYNTQEDSDTQPADTHPRKTIYQKIRELPRKIKENPQKAITCFLAGLAVGGGALTMGCVEKPEELQDRVNIYVYEEAGGEGDPEEQIRDFYDIVDQQSGPPVIVPVAQYAAEYELDPQTGQVIPDTLKIYDSGGNPVDRETALAMQDDIATDDAGNIITDAALLDIHIEEIGKNKYQIHNLKQELQVEDSVWRVKGIIENDSFDKKLVDNIMKVGDNKDEITGGLVRGEDGNIYGVIIADEDVFSMYGANAHGYGGDFGTHAWGENLPRGINKQDCIDLGGGLYAYLYNLSETPRGNTTILSTHPFVQEASMADKKNNGKYAQFWFLKESI